MCLSHPVWPVANLGQEPRPDGSRLHCGSLNGVGARLCPSDPRHQYAADLPGDLPRAANPPRRVLAASVNSETRRARPKSARLESVIRVEGRNNAGSSRTPLHHVRRKSGSADTSRLRQGCSHPPRHHPDQAALNSIHLLRQADGKGLSPPLEPTAPQGANRPPDTSTTEAAPDSAARAAEYASSGSDFAWPAAPVDLGRRASNLPYCGPFKVHFGE
jgi:hypothetical protein